MAKLSKQLKIGPVRPKSIPLLTFEARLKRSLRKHLKSLGFVKGKDGRLAPEDKSKEGIRQLHAFQRQEVISKSRTFIEERKSRLIKNFANGKDIVPHLISPRLELVEAGTEQSDIFRFASLTWAVPVSQGYGRRMRFLVWDDYNDKLIGIFALGDPVFNLRMRDQLIGWTQEMRQERLVNVLDAFVLGSVPPYNKLLGGKLVASLIRTKEVRDHFAKRYRNSKGVISKKAKNANLVMVTTSSSLGRSSIYNRLTLGGTQYFRSIGYTEGWGHFHIPDDLFSEMRKYLERKKHPYAKNHRFGNGPNWKFRTVREALSLLGENSDILCHNIQRELFVNELAVNARKILLGEAVRPNYRGLLSVQDVAELARNRWIIPRAERVPDFKSWSKQELIQLFSPVVGIQDRNTANVRSVGRLAVT